MTEPTDNDLDVLLAEHWPAFATVGTHPLQWMRAAMRDAIAKWGTPAGAGEPVAWRYRMKGDLQWQYTERKEQFAHADEIQPLHTAPRPARRSPQKSPFASEEWSSSL